MNKNIKLQPQAGIKNGLRWRFVIHIDDDENWYATIKVDEQTKTTTPSETFEQCWDEAFMQTMALVDEISREGGSDDNALTA
jgi:hypothetical protein